MSFKLGSQSFGFVWEGSAVNATEQLAAAGFQAIELLAMPPHFDVSADSKANIQLLAKVARATGIEVLGLGLPANDFNLASTDANVIEFTISKYKQAIEAAVELDSRRLIVIAGRKHALLPPPDNRLLDILTASLEKLIPYAEAHGVKIVLENHPACLLPKAEQMDAYIKHNFLGSLGIVYDVANGFAAQENPADGIRAISQHLSHVHLSDSPAGGWRHDPIGTGGIDFKAILNALEGINFNRPVLLEIIATPALAQALASKATLESLGWSFG